MPLDGHRVLVVEDESLIAFEIESIIREAHGEGVCAPRLAKAMQLAGAPHLSAAILDFQLGSENSLPVAAKLYAASVPFLFYTASGYAAMSQEWPNVSVLHKPASPNELVRSLIALLTGKPALC
jgi:DNA-binding response OmpR family regulator